MKKHFLNIIATLLISLYIILFFLAAKTAGFLILTLLTISSILVIYFSGKLKTKRDVYKDDIYFNPSEFQWYLPMFIIDFFAFYYYNNLPSELKAFDSNNYVLIFLFSYFLIPSIVFLIIIFKNNNDRVVLSIDKVTWFDNDQETCVLISDIKNIKIQIDKIGFIFRRAYVALFLIDGRELAIPTYKMNITKSGAIMIMGYIEELQSKSSSFEAVKIAAKKIDKIENWTTSIFSFIKGLATLVIGKAVVYLFAYLLAYGISGIIKLFI